MKKVKVMLTAVLVMAVVGIVLAFNLKGQTFCRYKINGGTCPLIDRPWITQLLGAGDQTVITKAAWGCPAFQPTDLCTRSFNVTLNQ